MDNDGYLIFCQDSTDQAVGGVRGGLFGGIGGPGGPGSLVFVRLVAERTPMPIITMTPTAIHVGGTLSRYAPAASPMIRMMKPMRYVEKEDMSLRARLSS